MKKIFYLFVASMLLFSCSSDDDPVILPKMTFAEATYSVPKGVTQHVKVLLDEPVVADTRVMLTFAGTAVKGTDYNAPASYVDVVAGEKSGSIAIQVKSDITESKTIELSFKDPIVGYDFGRFPKTVITTSLEKATIFSFAAPKGEIPGDEAIFGINLFDQQGAPLRVAAETKVSLKATPSSTAVLGTHYKFKDGDNSATILKDKGNGTFTIEVLKYEEGKNTIVLECGESAGYFGGAVPQIVITIPKRISERVVGEWKGLDFYKLDGFAEAWGLDAQQKAALPTCGPTDILNFKADKKFEITSSGKLKNYFVNTTWAIDGSDLIVLGMAYPPEKYTAPRCKLGEVNYAFSADKKDMKAAKINLFVTSSSEHKEILVLQINQHGNDSDFSFIWGDPLTFRFIRK